MYRKISSKESEKLLIDLTKNGWCVIRQYINQETVDDLITTIEVIYKKFWDNHEVSINAAPHGIQNIIKTDRMVNNLFVFDDKFITLSSSGEHLNIIGHFLNDPNYGLLPKNENNFILSQFNARDGKNSLPFHVDVRLQMSGPSTWSMQGFLSLDKLDETNGALKVRTGSHLLSNMPDSTKNYTDSITINTEPGDFLIFHSNLHHATSTNNQGARGWTILSTYRSWWCKQQFDIWAMLENRKSELTNQQRLIFGACSAPSANPFSSASSRMGYDVL
jgi:Phytanoyl-CoA dioxygenase (PhyH)